MVAEDSAMTETSRDQLPPPALARALAARTAAQMPREFSYDALVRAFAEAVVQLDAADTVYRETIGEVLPELKARETIAAMGEYRSRIAGLREHLRSAAGYADFDPLDVYVPAPGGSHANAVRVASATDRARHEAAELRSQVNERVVRLLDRPEIERLTEAKRVRNASFDHILGAAMPPQTGDKLATQLLLLVDGWY
jgi:hypothetical protein